MKCPPSLKLRKDVGAIGEELSDEIHNREYCACHQKKDDRTPRKPSLDNVIEASTTKKAWEKKQQEFPKSPFLIAESMSI